MKRTGTTVATALGEIGRTSLLVLMFGGAIRSKGVLREMAKPPAAADDEPGSAMESELLALAHRAASDGREPGPSGVAPTAQREHARDWVLRPVLVAADVLGCAAALLFLQLAFVNERRQFGPNRYPLDSGPSILPAWVVRPRSR